MSIAVLNNLECKVAKRKEEWWFSHSGSKRIILQVHNKVQQISCLIELTWRKDKLCTKFEAPNHLRTFCPSSTEQSERKATGPRLGPPSCL